MEVSYQLKATRTSTVRVRVVEVGMAVMPTDYVVFVNRHWRKNGPKGVELRFTRAKSSSTCMDILAGIIAKGWEKKNPFDLAIFADAVQDDPAWQNAHSDLAWSLEQLRLVSGVKPV